MTSTHNIPKELLQPVWLGISHTCSIAAAMLAIATSFYMIMYTTMNFSPNIVMFPLSFRHICQDVVGNVDNKLQSSAIGLLELKDALHYTLAVHYHLLSLHSNGHYFHWKTVIEWFLLLLLHNFTNCIEKKVIYSAASMVFLKHSLQLYLIQCHLIISDWAP